MNFWLSAVIALTMGLLLSLLIERLVYRPLKKLNPDSWKMLVASLGTYVVLKDFISISWGDNAKSLTTVQAQSIEVSGGFISPIQIAIIVTTTFIVILGSLTMKYTKWGKTIAAVSDNPKLSGIQGIDIVAVGQLSLVFGSFIAGVIGILMSMDLILNPTIGFSWLLFGVVAMIIGGLGKTFHILIGAMLLAAAQHVAGFWFDSKWMNATAYMILTLFIAWKPYGFSGIRLKKAEI